MTSHLHPVTQMFVTSNLIPNAAVHPDRCPSHKKAMTQVDTSFIQTNAISQGCPPSSPPYNIISNHFNHPLPTSPIPKSFTAAASDAAASTAEVTSASNAAASLAHASLLPPVQPHWHPFLVAAAITLPPKSPPYPSPLSRWRIAAVTSYATLAPFCHLRHCLCCRHVAAFLPDSVIVAT